MVYLNPIPNDQGRNQPLYERHVTKPGRNRVKTIFLSMSILGQKSCILGPTIFKIPQPNWHYMHFATSMYCNVFQMYHVFMEADNAFTYLLLHLKVA